MKKIFKLFAFIFTLFLSTFLPPLGAQQEIPFDDPAATISLDLQDAGLKDILKIFSIQSGLNFIASESVQERKITLYFDKTPIKEAMDKLFKANNLSYELDKDSNIIIVKDWGKPTIETITKIFYLKYATVSSSSLKAEMATQMSTTSDFSVDGTSTSAGGAVSGTSTSGKWAVEANAGITQAVKKLLSEYGSLVEDFRTNSLVVTDIPSRMPVITETIASLDIPVPQVMLEVEMLDVSKNAVDKLGVEWPTTLVKLTVPGSRMTKFPFGYQGTGGKSVTGLNPSAGMFGPTTTDWDYGIWDMSHFGPSILTVLGTTLTMDYLRTLTDTKFLARPKLLTLNNETAEIRIATNESIGVKTTTTSAGGQTGSTTAEAERTETGVILRVTPQVNPETGEITMFIYPKVAEATGGSTITSGSNTYVFRDPEERSTKSTVRVKDGETVVIGGLIRNEFLQVEKKLPILGDIPLLGMLFRHKGGTSDKNKERELLVFITPHIIKDKNIELAQAGTTKLPEREQSTATGSNRNLTISASLNNFEKKGNRKDAE